MKNQSKEPPHRDFSRKELFDLNDREELFSLKELLDSLGIPPVIQELRKFVLSLSGLNKKQVRNKLRATAFIEEKKFGKNDCLIYQMYAARNRIYLCLYNGDDVCFSAYQVPWIYLNS